MNKRILSLVLLASILAAALGVRLDTLTVRDLSTGHVLHRESARPGTAFMVRWIHSVELEPWEEHFVIGGDRAIYLEKTRFKAFGAGVPDSAGTRTVVEDGYVVFSGIHRKMEDLVYGASPLARHTFVSGKATLRLYELAAPDAPVAIRVEKTSLATRLLQLLQH